MSGINLTSHYQEIDQETIDITDQVMDKIMSKEKKVRPIKMKFIAVVAAIMVFTLGCGYIATHTFMGPDGSVLWESEYVEMDYNEEVQVIRDEQVLLPGEIIHILISEEGIINTSQEPFIVSDYDMALEWSKGLFDMTINSQYETYDYSHTKLSSVFDRHIDEGIMNEMYEMAESQPSVIYMEESDISDSTSVEHVYTNDEDNLVISVVPWNGNTVTYSNDYSKSLETFEVDGYEGMIHTDGQITTYKIIVEEQYLSISFTKDTISEATLRDIIQTFIHK